MPMNKSLYPIDWHEIALAIKEAVDWQCQQCGMQCRRPGEPFDTHRRTLTVAHWDHYLDEKDVFLVALCPTCHNRHDGKYRAQNRARRWRRGQELAGQRNFLHLCDRLRLNIEGI